MNRGAELRIPARLHKLLSHVSLESRDADPIGGKLVGSVVLLKIQTNTALLLRCGVSSQPLIESRIHRDSRPKNTFHLGSRICIRLEVVTANQAFYVKEDFTIIEGMNDKP